MTSIWRSQKKVVHSQQEHRKKCSSQLFRKWEKLVPSYFAKLAWQTLLQLFGDLKKWIPAFRRLKKQFTTVRSKEKDYDIYLKSEKLVHNQQELGKNVFSAIWKWKKLVPSYFEPDKHCCSYLEIKKSGSLLLGDQKNGVHNCQEQGKRL